MALRSHGQTASEKSETSMRQARGGFLGRVRERGSNCSCLVAAEGCVNVAASFVVL